MSTTTTANPTAIPPMHPPSLPKPTTQNPSSTSSSNQPSRFQQSFGAILCGCAIISCLLIYALLQERIMPRLHTNTTAAIALMLKGDYNGLKNTAPLHKYMMVSVSNVIATSCQYEALKWITFPTQTLAKCAKMMPVMIWGTLMSRKRHKVVDYGVAVGVMVGRTVFLLAGNIKAKKAAVEDSYFGLVLMGGYLMLDGFTSTFQEKLFEGYAMSIYNQMLYVNLCSGLISMAILVISGKWKSSVEFVVAFSQIVKDVSVLSSAAVLGQFAITCAIKEFGALVFATIMTIRQFLSVLLSNMLFRHGMKLMQWFGAILVFRSLFYKKYSKSGSTKGTSNASDAKKGPAGVNVSAKTPQLDNIGK